VYYKKEISPFVSKVVGRKEGVLIMINEINIADYFELLNWNELKRNHNKVYNVDIDNSYTQSEDITDKFNREELLKIESFVFNTSHEMTSVGSINHYVVIDKIIDNNNNLILFTKSRHYHLQR
jgi:hypothetical protein